MYIEEKFTEQYNRTITQREWKKQCFKTKTNARQNNQHIYLPSNAPNSLRQRNTRAHKPHRIQSNTAGSPLHSAQRSRYAHGHTYAADVASKRVQSPSGQ